MMATDNSIVKSRFEIDEQSKREFSEASCVILISVGQAAHEGAKLKATVDRCVKQFKSVSVAVCDSLQRHSIQVEQGIPEDDAYELSNQLGLEWIYKYSSLLTKCNKSYFRWDAWLTREDFEEKRKIIVNAYENNQEFKESMKRTVRDYTVRVIKRAKKKLSKNAVETASLAYLVEECAVIMLMWQEMSYNYIVYPSSILDVMNEAYKLFVTSKSGDLLKWARIKLKTKRIEAKVKTKEFI